MKWNEPDPDKRITNADEQEVAVNHSTREEGGYDEPASTRQKEPSSSETESGISNPEKRRGPQKKGDHPGSRRKVD